MVVADEEFFRSEGCLHTDQATILVRRQHELPNSKMSTRRSLRTEFWSA